MKACSTCKQRIPLIAFYKNKNMRSGFTNRCRICEQTVRRTRKDGGESPRPRAHKIAVLCDHCGKGFQKPPSLIKAHNFCSPSHYHSWLSRNRSGIKNPNYGRRWTQERRKRQSEFMKERMKSPESRWQAGTANRGKKFSPERCRQMHEHRPRESYSRPNPSKETRRKIGEASRKKFTDPIYRERVRQTMEERGHWIPLADKPDYDIYFVKAGWPRRMWDLVADSNQLALLENHGVFNAHKNSKGVVRDHMFSRRSGFERGVFPEIMRHPCNLQILAHADNVAKKRSRYVDADSLSLEELFESIRIYESPWFEQATVLAQIANYEKGERWER